MTNTISKVFGGVEFSKSWDELKNHKPDNRTSEQVTKSVLDKVEKLKEEYS